MDAKTFLVMIIVCGSLYFMFRFQNIQTRNNALTQENQTLKLIVPIIHNTQAPARASVAGLQEMRNNFDANEQTQAYHRLSEQQSDDTNAIQEVDPSAPLLGHDHDRPPMIRYNQDVDPKIPAIRHTTNEITVPQSATTRQGTGASPFSAQHMSLMESSDHNTVMQDPIAGLMRNEPTVVSGAATSRTYV